MEIITRKQYTASVTGASYDPKTAQAKHQAYYIQVARLAGIKVTKGSELHRLMVLNPHNITSLGWRFWDIQAAKEKSAISKALQQCGDFYTDCGGICTMKAAFRAACEEYIKTEEYFGSDAYERHVRELHYMQSSEYADALRRRTESRESGLSNLYGIRV